MGALVVGHSQRGLMDVGLFIYYPTKAYRAIKWRGRRVSHFNVQNFQQAPNGRVVSNEECF